MTADLLAHLSETIIDPAKIAAGQIFISYSRQTRDFAKALYGKLDRMKFKLWQDVHGIEAGADDWWQQIQAAIDGCETVILVMSLPALKSPVVGDEWLCARKQGKRVIPVVADDIWTHPEVKAGTFTIPNWMQRKNWLDFRDSAPDRDAAWANLIRTLNEIYTPKRFIAMVEELPPRFVRRPEDIDRAVRGLIDDKNDAVAMTTALSGAGGYGKTTLAKAVARDVRIQGAFDDGILWVTLGEKLLELSGDALTNVLIGRVRELINALTGETPVMETLEMAQTRLQAAIGKLYLLLVIDDVWDAAHLKPFLLDSKETPHSACLITTRSLNTVNRDTILKQTVDRMKPIEAVELLGAGFDPDEVKANDAGLRSLAHDMREYALLLGLANTQIANYAYDMGLSLADALDLARETLREQGVLGFDDTSAASRNAAVSKSLDVSIRQITPEDQQPLYRELAIFPDDALIALSTLEKYWGLSKIATLQFCQMLYRKTALLHSFEGMSIRLHDVYRDCLMLWERDHLPALHRRLTDSWGITDGATITVLPDDYAWHNIAYHLIEGGQADRLRTLLIDYRFLRAKLGATDASALVTDCDALLKLGKDETIRVLRSAIILSENVLAQDKDALGHQLVGRMMVHRQRNPELLALTDSVPALQPGLYPIDFDSEYVTHIQADGLLLRTLAGHSQTINGILILANNCILSFSLDQTLRLWAEDGQFMASFLGHRGDVNGALELSNGNILSWSADCTLRLWSKDGEPLNVLAGHTHEVTGALELPSSQILSWGLDHTLRLWSYDGMQLGIFGKHNHIVERALLLTSGSILSWSWDKTLRIWNTHGKLHAILNGHTDTIWGALEMRDGRLLSWSQDGTLRIWSADGDPLLVMDGHTESVVGVTELDFGRILSWSEDGKLRLWMLDGTLLTEMEGHHLSVLGTLVTSNYQILSWGNDNSLRLWGWDGDLITVLEGHTRRVNGALEIPGGRLLSWSEDNTLRLWSLNGVRLGEIIGHADGIKAARMWNDGNILSFGGDNIIQLWSLNEALWSVSLGHTDKVTGILSLKNDRLLTFSSDNTLRLWKDDGSLLAILSGHTAQIDGALVLNDGRFISWSYDSTFRLWTSDGTVLAIFEGHTHIILGVIQLGNGHFLSWSYDRTVRMWNEKGIQLKTLTGHLYTVTDAWAFQNGCFLTWSENEISLWTSDGDLILSKQEFNATQASILDWVNRQGIYEEVLFSHYHPLSIELDQFDSFADVNFQNNELTLKNRYKGAPLIRWFGDKNFSAIVVISNEKTIVVGDDIGHVIFLHYKN